MERPHLLLVEDDALVAMVAEGALEAGGFIVTHLSSGNEALSALSESADQLAGIITDIRLGDGPDGWAVARAARDGHPSIPVVYLTADSAADWARDGVPNSVLIQKPYAPAQLVSAISALITARDSHP